MRPEIHPNVLVIAGLDPSGGAGLVADVRVCERHGCRPVAIATALTEQSSVEVRAVNPVSAAVVGDQLAMVLTDVEMNAVKIGMLADEAVADEVARALDLTGAPVVWDPILRPTAGQVFLYEGDPHRLVERLGDRVALCTPNAPEAEVLTGIEITSVADAIAAGQRLCARGMAAALIKGGHWGGADEVIDVLVIANQHHVLRSPRTAVAAPVHGTGCALSTAIACRLAAGAPLLEACQGAKKFVAELIAGARRPGRGRAAVL